MDEREREQWIESNAGRLYNIGAIPRESIPDVVGAMVDAMSFADRQREEQIKELKAEIERRGRNAVLLYQDYMFCKQRLAELENATCLKAYAPADSLRQPKE